MTSLRTLSRRSWAVWAAAILALAVALVWSSTFQVDANGLAWVTGWGRPVSGPVVQPGLYAKWPWQRVRMVDGRVRLFESTGMVRQTADGQTMQVRACVLWRVARDQVGVYLAATGDEREAEALLGGLIGRSVDDLLSAHELADWFNPSRDHGAERPGAIRLADELTRTLRPEAYRRYGIELLDVGFVRLGHPASMADELTDRTEAVQQRRIAAIQEQTRIQAAAIRQTGRQEADNIRADARREAEMIRAQGHFEAERIFDEARQLDADLARLINTLENCRPLLDANMTIYMTPQQATTAPSPTSQTDAP